MLRLISKYIKDVNKLVFVFETQQPNESYFDYEIIESLKPLLEIKLIQYRHHHTVYDQFPCFEFKVKAVNLGAAVSGGRTLHPLPVCVKRPCTRTSQRHSQTRMVCSQDSSTSSLFFWPLAELVKGIQGLKVTRA